MAKRDKPQWPLSPLEVCDQNVLHEVVATSIRVLHANELEPVACADVLLFAVTRPHRLVRNMFSAVKLYS